MRSDDVERIVLRALDITGLAADQRPRLLSDNGSCYVSSDLKEFWQNNPLLMFEGNRFILKPRVRSRDITGR